MSKTTVIDLIRHGEPVGGRAYRGDGVDDPLSELGWTQMRQAVGAARPWQRVITSPLQRCFAFAETIVAETACELVVESRFREVGFGSWEGKTPEILKRDSLKEYEAFYNDPVNARPVGAEALKSFIDRVSAAYEEHLDINRGQHILIVTHAGVMRAIISQVLGGDYASMYRIKINNAGIARIRYANHRASLECINCTMSNMGSDE